MFYKWVLLSLLSTSFAGSHSGWVDSNWLDPSPLTGNMHTVPEHQIDFTNTLIAMNLMPQANHAMRGWLGLSKAGRPVEAWYFPGTSKQRALIVGGMHGSELSSIALANSIIADLQSGPPPYYSVIIIPTLFPDNAAVAEMNPTQLGSVENLGRYTYSGATDPNRQMPTPGKAFDPAAGIDHFGRPVEREIQYLLELIQEFRPTRIANLHAIRNNEKGGIFADPRTNHLGLAWGYGSDSSLAIDMAKMAMEKGAKLKGNGLPDKPNTVYYLDPAPVAPGQWQPRNLKGAPQKLNKRGGVSLGTWGSTAIANENDSLLNREAMRVITVEFPGSRRPQDYLNAEEKFACERQVQAFSIGIRTVFLGDKYLD